MPTAVRSAGDAGSKVKVVTFDLHKELEGATVKGDIEFVVDRQSHRQGYLSVDSLWLYKATAPTRAAASGRSSPAPPFVDKGEIVEVAWIVEIVEIVEVTKVTRSRRLRGEGPR